MAMVLTLAASPYRCAGNNELVAVFGASPSSIGENASPPRHGAQFTADDILSCHKISGYFIGMRLGPIATEVAVAVQATGASIWPEHRFQTINQQDDEQEERGT
jgi:hypothetical protein